MANILVVDEQVAVRRFLGTVLTRKGHAVEAAASASEALERFQRERPEMTFIEPMMSGGLEVMAEMRRLSPQVGIVVIAPPFPSAGWFLKVAIPGVHAVRKPLNANKVLSAVESGLAVTI